MFFVDGYLSPRMVMYALSSHAAKTKDIDLSKLNDEEWRRFALNEFWSFAETIDFAEFMTPSGTIIRGEAKIIQSPDKCSENGYYFSPWIGILGSFIVRPMPRTIKGWVIMIILQQHFYVVIKHYLKTSRARTELRDFSGMTVVFSKESVKSFLFPKDDTEESDVKTERQVCKNIVNAFDRGEVFSKDEAQERFGGSLTKRGFLRAWGRAAEERPDLSRPGRRSRRAI